MKKNQTAKKLTKKELMNVAGGFKGGFPGSFPGGFQGNFSGGFSMPMNFGPRR